MRKILIGILLFIILGYIQNIEKVEAKLTIEQNPAITIKLVQEISKKERQLATKIDSKDNFCQEIRNSAIDREKNIKIIYKKDYKTLISWLSSLGTEELKKEICGIDLVENSGFDYLLYNIETVSIIIKQTKESRKNALITVKLTYYETKAQEEKVNAVIALALYRLGISKGIYLTDLEKAKLIHDYVVNALSYSSSIQTHSTYDAVITGKSGGYGYALLTYKMLSEVGIPNRVVTGTAINSTPHAWNVVFVNGNWYYIDCAYDDPVGEVPMIDYQYFLVSDYTINYNHILSESYNAEKFRQKYAVSSLNYPWLEYLNQLKNTKENIIPSEIPIQTPVPIPDIIPSESPSPEITAAPAPIPTPSPSETPSPSPSPDEIVPPVVDPSEVMNSRELFRAILNKAFEDLKTPDYGYTEETLDSLPEDILQEIYNYIGTSITEGATLKDLDEITMSIAGFLYEKGYES